MPSGKYELVEDAAKHIWGKKSHVMDECKGFYVKHAAQFVDAPNNPREGEQDLVMYSLFQEYLKLFEGVLEDYIESQKVSVTDFYRELAEVQNDTGIDKMDKKLVHFVNYLVACTDYDAFYKMMVRAAKKEKRADAKTGGGDVVTPDFGGAKGGAGSKGGTDDGSDAKGVSRGGYEDGAKGAPSSRSDYK